MIRTLILAVLLALPAVAELRAGTAKAVITNTQPRVMVNGEISEGTLTDIYTRVLVLNDDGERFVFVVNDLNCLDVATPILRERVAVELDIPIERLIILATHTHNAPIQIVPDNFAYGRKLADKIFETIEAAIEKERGPVRLEFASTYGHWLRAMGNAPVDAEIQVLRVMHEDAPLAAIFTQGAHPQQASARKVDAGHPGFAVEAVEAAWPGAMAIYADACGGNQFMREPRDYRKALIDARKGGDDAVDAIHTAAAKKLGERLAAKVLAIPATDYEDVTGRIESRWDRLSLPLADPLPRAEAEELLEKHGGQEVGLVPYPDPRRKTNWVRMLWHHYENDVPFAKRSDEMICTDDTYLIHKSDTALLEQYDDSIHDTQRCIYNEVISTSIGPMLFVAIQGEVCAPIGMRVKDFFRAEIPTMVVGYMGEHNLYLPTREMVRLGIYQATVIQTQYASPVGWAPEVEDEAVRGIIRAAQKILKD